ncbi:MAG: FAD-dependent oxidoreductase, partial [Rhizobiales bacterium]|nr:FAD-dependent oxidoreductase [Hyphomicrobiales bacterium]
RARALWALSAEGVAEVRAVLADGQGAAVPAGQLTLWQDAGAETVEIASRSAAQLRYFGADAQARTAAQVSAALRGVAGAPGVHRADAFSVNPHDYMRLLVARAEEAGVRIFENAGLAMMDVNGVRKHVIGQAGQVRAAHIVLAAGGENAELHPQLARSVGTLWRPVAATAPLDRLAAEVVAFEGLVSFAGRDAERFRRDGERLIHAGALQAAGRLPPAFALRVARRIGRLFPALRGLTVATTWLAQERLTAHRMPQVAEIAPSLWVADAFGDAGIGNATMAGELIARGISEGDDRWRLFDVYGLGRAGLATHRGVAAATLGLGRAARVLRALAKRVVSADAAEQYPLPAPSVPALQHAPQPVALIAAPVQAIATPAVVDPATAESETLPEPVPAVAAATPAKPVRKRAPRSKKPAVEA